MPLFFCPNDNASMQTVQRSGVEFDICPTCRAVWLDRGELEKLLAAAGEAAPGERQVQGQPQHAGFGRGAPPPADRGRSWGDGDDDDDDDYRRKKSRRGIFDIFD